MSSLIQRGLGTARSVGRSILLSVYGFIKRQAHPVIMCCGTCGKSAKLGQRIDCSFERCPVTEQEASGITSITTTQPLSSTDWALALRHKYGISKPMEDE